MSEMTCVFIYMQMLHMECTLDGKSHSACVMKVGHGTVAAKSTKQKIVTKSTTEAELVCATDMIPPAFGMKEFITEQGYSNVKIILHQETKIAAEKKAAAEDEAAVNSARLLLDEIRNKRTGVDEAAARVSMLQQGQIDLVNADEEFVDLSNQDDEMSLVPCACGCGADIHPSTALFKCKVCNEKVLSAMCFTSQCDEGDMQGVCKRCDGNEEQRLL